jgi:hypothetical protein
MRDVDAGERLILYCLASHVNQRGLCWPSRETIARETSLTERGVIRILRRLEAKRIIRRVAQGGGKPGSCCRYEWPPFSSPEAWDKVLDYFTNPANQPSEPEPVTKLATKLATELTRIRSAWRSLRSKMSYRLGVQANDIKIRAGISLADPDIAL